MNVAQPGLAIEQSPLEMALAGMAAILFLAAFLCFVIVVVKMFQKNEPAIGVVSIVSMCIAFIGFMVTLIYGWMRAREWNIKGLMTIYTICLLGSIILGLSWMSVSATNVMNAAKNNPQLQQRIQELSEEMQQGLEEIEKQVEE